MSRPPFMDHRQRAHHLLAQAVPQWPATLAEANASHRHRLVERTLAAVLASQPSTSPAPTTTPCTDPRTTPASATSLPTLHLRHVTDWKSLAAGEGLEP